MPAIQPLTRLLRTAANLYAFRFATTLLSQYRFRNSSAWRLLRYVWTDGSYEPGARLGAGDRTYAGLLMTGMLLQIVAGIVCLVDWARFGTVGAWEFGAALLISYPIVWAHILALAASIGRLVYFLSYPKKAGRAIVCRKLEYQVRQLRRRHDFQLVAVAGSVGKTSTKLATAQLLGQNLRVRYQTGNYNDRVTVPLVLFGLEEPNILNVAAWFKTFRANSRVIRADYPYDVVVVELGTDAPGAMAEFAYLHPDITVVTAVSPEHMEYFKTLDAVAAEELQVFDYSKRVLVNGDDIAGSYLAGREFTEYSLTSQQAEYRAKSTTKGLGGQSLAIELPADKLKATVRYLGTQGAKSALAAAAVADMLGLSKTVIAEGLPGLEQFAGRMQVLAGVHGSTLIDDTYNASPIAVCAALDVLYAAKTTQRIAILGSMNELGDYSQQAHAEVGAYCDPKKLDAIITIGADAEKWLAPAAKKAGCNVVSFTSPYDAGDYVKNHLKKGAVVLAKGSQNGVFAEEALKAVLQDDGDAAKLVRQSPNWIVRKKAQFNG